MHEQLKSGDEESLRAKLNRAYDREAATREILAVISQSGDDEQPVFEAILNSATNLCHAPLAFLSLVDETETYLSIPAHKGARPKMQKAFVGLRHSIAESEIVSAHVVREKSIIRIDDMASDPNFDRSDPHRAQLIDVEGVRSYLVVPMLQGDICLGTFYIVHFNAHHRASDVVIMQSFSDLDRAAEGNLRGS